jgi:hypothetical protein
VCYASSGPTATPEPSVPALAQRLANLRREAGPCNVQLSGGEPTTRGDLPEIIAAARAQGFGLVQLNTNGLRLGTEPGYACRLAQAGLQSVFLQFDGTDEACQVLRGRPLMREKLAALDACAEAGLAVVLVPTLLRGVNDQALGAILRLAQERMPVVRGVHFQPASSFGRFPGRMAESQRLTLPEVLTLLVAQSAGLLRAEDFHPPCCEHERCSFSGSFTLQGGRFVPLSGGGCCDTAPITAAPATAAPITAAPISAAPISAAPITAAEGARRAMASVAGQWAAAPAPSTAPALDDFERFLASRGPQTRLALSCMAFQDAQTLDLERVRGCCIHTLAPDGRLVPFCLYNLTATDGTPLYRRSQ